MLTDYHVHLRPDDLEHTAAEAFTPANADRYRETAESRGVQELGVSEHIYRFTAALDVWQHPLWRDNATDDIDAYCEFVRAASPSHSKYVRHTFSGELPRVHTSYLS